jgi:hypothetical protein
MKLLYRNSPRGSLAGHFRPARSVPIRTLALRAHARLTLRVRVFGQPLVITSFATETPEGEFYFCHASHYTMKNICCQVIYTLTYYIP